MYEEFHCCMLSRVTRGSQGELSLINIQIDVECIIKKKLIPRFVRLFQMIAQRNIETIDSISLRSIKSNEHYSIRLILSTQLVIPEKKYV